MLSYYRDLTRYTELAGQLWMFMHLVLASDKYKLMLFSLAWYDWSSS